MKLIKRIFISYSPFFILNFYHFISISIVVTIYWFISIQFILCWNFIFCLCLAYMAACYFRTLCLRKPYIYILHFVTLGPANCSLFLSPFISLQFALNARMLFKNENFRLSLKHVYGVWVVVRNSSCFWGFSDFNAQIVINCCTLYNLG